MSFILARLKKPISKNTKSSGQKICAVSQTSQICHMSPLEFLVRHRLFCLHNPS